ncbi:MAG: twin-arginine translocation signal domain-containing protein, partial [bacterium]
MERRRFLAGTAAAGGWLLATREGAPSTPSA